MFLSMVTEFGIMGSQSNFEALFDGFDTDGDGSISLKEFVLLLRVMSDDTPEDKVKWAFATYDENKDGLIDTHEMKRYLAQSNIVFFIFICNCEFFSFVGTVYEMMKRDGNASEYTEALISKLDKNQDGKISQAEAVNACV